MRNIKVFELSIAGTAFRFYAMMALVVILGFLNQFAIAAILGFSLALSFILGASFTKTTRQVIEKGKIKKIGKTLQRAA